MRLLLDAGIQAFLELLDIVHTLRDQFMDLTDDYRIQWFSGARKLEGKEVDGFTLYDNRNF